MKLFGWLKKKKSPPAETSPTPVNESPANISPKKQERKAKPSLQNKKNKIEYY